MDLLIGDREGDTLFAGSDADTFVLLENEATNLDNLEVMQILILKKTFA